MLGLLGSDIVDGNYGREELKAMVKEVEGLEKQFGVEDERGSGEMRRSWWKTLLSMMVCVTLNDDLPSSTRQGKKDT